MKPKIPFDCVSCEKTFHVNECETKRPKRPLPKYCSRVCYATHYQAVHGGRNRKTGTMVHRGYVLEWNPDHPNSVKGYVYQHRLVMERHIGRLLTDDEAIHHLNHIRNDNRVENLELMNKVDHSRLHALELRKIIKAIGFEKGVSEWCRFLSIDKSSFNQIRKSKNWTHEETLNYYLAKRRMIE